MPEQEPLSSPRLTVLREALAAGDGAAADAFWAVVAREGTPLVEPVAGAPDQVWLTFLWRAVVPECNVVVQSGLSSFEPAQGRMARLGASDVWYRTYRVPRDLRLTYALSVDNCGTSADAAAAPAGESAWQPDPRNPRTYVLHASDEPPGGQDWVQSVIELPDAPPQPWVVPRPGVPAGRLDLHRIHSAALDNTRRIWVYTPPGYSTAGVPSGVLVLFDGRPYHQIVPTPTILDNLLAAGRIPPLVALLISQPTQESRAHELPCYPPFFDFLAGHLVPWLRAHYHVSTDPARAIIAGSSYGGLAAAFAGWRHADLFGNVLAQSGAFSWRPAGDPEHEWLARQFAAGPLLPLRFYLEVGRYESGPSDENGPPQEVANRHLRDVLRAKGYPVTYREYNGGHDYFYWQGSLADGLLALLAPPG